jgi:hypothetical protein
MKHKQFLDAIERFKSSMWDVCEIVYDSDYDYGCVMQKDYPFNMSFEEVLDKVITWENTMKKQLNKLNN